MDSCNADIIAGGLLYNITNNHMHYSKAHRLDALHYKECHLADVHILLADLASEQESFEEALTDLKKSQDLLTQLLQARHCFSIRFCTAHWV